jgi:hypothetical protein
MSEKMFESKPVSTIEEFVELLQSQMNEYYSTVFPTLEVPKIRVKTGIYFHKILRVDAGGSSIGVWGFISRYSRKHKGVDIKRGDLLKAASFNSPAARSRGNVIDGTARYSAYGPDYLK